MAGSSETVYIKADRDIEVTKPDVMLGDVLTLECADQAVVSRLKTVKLLKFRNTDDKHQNRTAVSILKVIQCIHECYPNIEVQNMGETDFIVTYEEQQTAGGTVHYIKAVIVVIISFFGAAFSIMAFNNDVDTTKLFSQIYELLTVRRVYHIGTYLLYRTDYRDTYLLQSFRKEEIHGGSDADGGRDAPV